MVDPNARPATCGKRGTTPDSAGGPTRGQPLPSRRPFLPTPDPLPPRSPFRPVPRPAPVPVPPRSGSAPVPPRTPRASRSSLGAALRFRLGPRPRSCYATAQGPGGGLPGRRPEGPLRGAGCLARCREGVPDVPAVARCWVGLVASGPAGRGCAGRGHG